MKIYAPLVCGGTLLAATSLLIDIGVAWEFSQVNATTRVGPELPLNQDISHTQYATTATTDGDGNDDGDGENRALPLMEDFSHAITKPKDLRTLAKYVHDSAMHSITSKLFNKKSFRDVDLPSLFGNERFQNKMRTTLKLYLQNKKKAYALVYLCLVKHVEQEDLPKLFRGPFSTTSHHFMVAQLNHWKERSIDTTKVYDLLELRREGSQLLNNWKLYYWTHYSIDAGETPGHILWEILNRHGSEGYSVVELIEMLRAPRDNIVAKVYGRYLEVMLLTKWKTNMTPLSDVLHYLGLHQPAIDVWLAYLHTVPKYQFEILTIGEFSAETIARVISTVRQSKNKKLVSKANTMLQAQYEKWKQDGFKSDSLFDAFKLKNEDLEHERSLLWDVWASYADYLENYRPAARKLITDTVMKHYNGDVYLKLKIVARQFGTDKIDLKKQRLPGEWWRPFE